MKEERVLITYSVIYAAKMSNLNMFDGAQVRHRVVRLAQLHNDTHTERVNEISGSNCYAGWHAA